MVLRNSCSRIHPLPRKRRPLSLSLVRSSTPNLQASPCGPQIKHLADRLFRSSRSLCLEPRFWVQALVASCPEGCLFPQDLQKLLANQPFPGSLGLSQHLCQMFVSELFQLEKRSNKEKGVKAEDAGFPGAGMFALLTNKSPARIHPPCAKLSIHLYTAGVSLNWQMALIVTSPLPNHCIGREDLLFEK